MTAYAILDLTIKLTNLKNSEFLIELKETFIFPQEEDVLFELYWVIKMIQQNTKNAQLQVMGGRNRHNLVAEWMDEENVYKIYHDSTGSDRIKFEQGFDKNTFWSGRPDIIVEV